MTSGKITKDYIYSDDSLMLLGVSAKVYSEDLVLMTLPQSGQGIVGLVERLCGRAEVISLAAKRIQWLRKGIIQSTIPSSSAYLVLDTVLIQYLWVTGEIAFVQDDVRLIQLNNLECPVVGEMEIEGHLWGIAAASYEVFRKPTVLVCFYSRGKFRVQHNYQLEV
jgi:hypothetical protein